MKALLTLVSVFLGVEATIYYAGVAQSGGEFAVWSATSTRGTGLPGRFGSEYSFINEATVSTFVDQHKVSINFIDKTLWHVYKIANKWQVNLFRVAFLLERMCPLSYGLGARFNETVSTIKMLKLREHNK